MKTTCKDAAFCAIWRNAATDGFWRGAETERKYGCADEWIGLIGHDEKERLPSHKDGYVLVCVRYGMFEEEYRYKYEVLKIKKDGTWNKSAGVKVAWRRFGRWDVLTDE